MPAWRDFIMNLASDDFELFELERRFALDVGELDRRWRLLQGEVHPDRFVGEGAAAKRLAMQWSVRVNEAYQRLKDPLRRAAYLCELGGVAIEAERNTAMPAAFLVQQLEWREALDDATTVAQVAELAARVDADRRSALESLASVLDVDRDAAAAAVRVRGLMFLERFVVDLDRRLEALGQ